MKETYGGSAMSDLSAVLQNLDKINEVGKINVYAIKNIHRPAKDSYAIALPSNMNKYFLDEYCKSMQVFDGFTCVKYDAMEYKENTYEYIDLSSVDSAWVKLRGLLKDDLLNRKNYSSLVSEVNLTLCELEFDNKTYYLGALQEKSETKFKGRFPILVDEGKLTAISADKLLTLFLKIDFVVSEDEK